MLKDWWKLFRAEHAVMTAVAVLAAEFVVSKSINLFSCLGPALITLGAFAWNDYFDFKTDKALKRKDRPLVSGAIKKQHAFIAGLLLMLLGAASAFAINQAAFSIALLFTILAMAYSISLKKLPLLGNAFIASAMSISFLYGNYVVSKELNFFVIVFAISAFLVGLGRELIITLRDVQGDKLIKAKTLPMILGDKNTVMLASFLIYLGVAASLVPLIYKANPAYGALIAIADALLFYSTFVVNAKRDFKTARNYTLYALGIGIMAFAMLGF